MIVPDLNLMVYAHVKQSPFHERARQWWEELVRSGTPIGMSLVVRLGFVRLLGNSTVVEPVCPPETSLSITSEWLALPNVVEIYPTVRHDEILRGLLRASGVAIRHINDAHLAALCLERNAELNSNDVEFLRFPKLRLKNPLADAVPD
jgi:toxin-antitoxin system PIN domain toxin